MQAGTAQRALQIINLSEKFPADPLLAQAHFRAQRYAPEMFFRCPNCGTNFTENRIVCPNCNINIEKEVYHCTCCRNKIKELQYDFCVDSSNQMLSPDIVVFFSFVKLVMIFFVFRFLILDIYSIYFNWHQNSCRFLNDYLNCPKTIFSRLATLRRVESDHSLFRFDLINLAFVLISILYLICCENYLHTMYLKVANSIQTEDDYSIYVYNIPVLLDNEQSTNYIGYRQALTSYFEQLVREWINTNAQTSNQSILYRDYIQVCQRRGDNPNSPAKIVTNISLCWDLQELINIRRQKRRIMRTFQRKSGRARAKQTGQVYWGLDQETTNKLEALNQAEIKISDKFVQRNHSSDFVIGRFLGKAYVSFEYQHFAHALIDTIHETEKFSAFRQIQIEVAPSPVDVHWGNLNIADSERKQRSLTTSLLTFGCIAIGFIIVLGLRYSFKDYYKIDDYDTKQGGLILAGSVSVTVLIVIINHAIKWVVGQLTDYEEHQTRTREEESLLSKLLMASFVNIVLSTLVVWRFMNVGVWDRNGLAVQVFVIMIAAIIIEIFLSIVNWRWVWRWLSLKCKYRPGEPILEFQFLYNDEYELPEFKLAQRFNYYLWLSYFLSFFSYLVPASSIIGLLAIAIHYFLDRINLLRRSSFHPTYSFTLARTAVKLLQTTVFIHALGNFIEGWIVKGTWYQPVNIITLLITIVFMIFVWAIVANKVTPCYYTTTGYEQLSYTDSDRLGKFFQSYQSQNPATRNDDLNQINQKYYGIDNTTINNSLIMSPTPVVGSLPQIGSQIRRSVI